MANQKCEMKIEPHDKTDIRSNLAMPWACVDAFEVASGKASEGEEDPSERVGQGEGEDLIGGSACRSDHHLARLAAAQYH